MTYQENRKKKSQVLLKTKSWKALFLLRTSLLNLMILMTTDIYLKHPITAQGFPLLLSKPDQKLSEDDYN
jgi:hypothetical protein